MTWSLAPLQAQSPVTVTPEEVELFTRPPVNERLPLHRGEPICIPVEVFGEKIIACLDTGTNVGALDSIYRHRLQGSPKTFNVKSLAGDLSIEFYRSPLMQVGHTFGMSGVNNELTACFDMSNLREMTGIDLRSVVGMTHVRHHVLQLNFDQGFAAIQPEVSSREGYRVAMKMTSLAYLKMEISDTGLQEFQIATGFTGGLTLEATLFQRLCERGRIILSKQPDYAAVVVGNIEHRIGLLDVLVLGPYRFRNIYVKEAAQNRIGLGFLERFETEFDFPNGRAYFRAGQLLNRPNRNDASGVALLRSDRGIEIMLVRSESVGEVAGLKTGDLIVELNGRPAHKMTLYEARNLFDQDDTELKVTVERAGQRISTTLKLVKISDPVPSSATDDSP